MNDYENLSLSDIKKLNCRYLDDDALLQLEDNINIKSIEHTRTIGYSSPEYVHLLTLIDDNMIEIII